MKLKDKTLKINLTFGSG